MIVWWDGTNYPIELQAGDVLFIVGCLPIEVGQKLPFEHVVITAEKRLIQSPADLLELPVYGMPESLPRTTRDASGILLQNGHFWYGRSFVGQTIGSAQTVWNLGGRARGVDATVAKEIELGLAQRAGSFRLRYGEDFRVDPSLLQAIQTNCLGFVCSILEYFDLHVLAHEFPIYPSPYSYSTDDRNFPSPGHLAHVLKIDPALLPWCAMDQEEAEKYSRADVTLSEAVSDAT